MTSALQETAVWFARPKTVELRREALPPVGPADVRVKALCSAISPGTEMLVYRGQVDPSLDLDLPTLQGSYGFPIKYGYASVGRIEEAGDGVRTLKAGDLVFVHHPHQSGYVVPAASAMPLPPGVEPEAGVFLANVETAVNVLLDAHPRLGDRVVVFGAGVVGLLIIQLLQRAGVASVIAVDPIAPRRRLAEKLGAASSFAPGERLRKAVMTATGDMGADLAIEVTGNPAALSEAIDCVGFQGTVVACSWYGTKPVTVDLGGRFHRGRVRVISSQVSNLDPALSPRWTMARRLELARELLATLPVAALITQRFPLEQAAAAYELVDQRPAETIQVVFTYV